MRLLATAKQDKQPALNITLTASRITQQGVHAGDNFFSWQDYTFEKTMPFTALTGADIRAKRDRIEAEIRYEASEGIHTYHNCDCGKERCRGIQGVKCWHKELEIYKDD